MTCTHSADPITRQTGDIVCSSTDGTEEEKNLRARHWKSSVAKRWIFGLWTMAQSPLPITEARHGRSIPLGCLLAGRGVPGVNAPRQGRHHPDRARVLRRPVIMLVAAR